MGCLQKDDCCKSDPDRNCFPFEIEKAEVCENDCLISNSDIKIDVKIKGKGDGTWYHGCSLEIFDLPNTSIPSELDFRWNAKKSWTRNYIKKIFDQKSNETKTYSALVQKSASARIGTIKTITVKFTHPHKHDVDLKVEIS